MRTHHSRQTQYDAPNLVFDGGEALRLQIIRLLHRREKPQRLKQIQKWFRATNPKFVSDQLDSLICDGRVVICRPTMGRAAHNCTYQYEIASDYYAQEIAL